MLLWDRPNCGKSDVQFYGQSESHMRAETLHALITGLDIGPCIIAGGSGGARDSMLTTMLYPEIVTKARGVEHRRRGLRLLRARRALHRAEHPRGPRRWVSKACLRVGEWKERIAENPANKDRFLALDTDEFLKVMLRWLNAFVSKPGQTIPGVDDEMFDNIKVPTLIIRGGENDWDHPKRTSLEVSCLIKGSKLIDPPWPEDAWERAGEERASGKGEDVQHVRHVGAGRARDPEVPGQLMTSLTRRADVHFAVERRLQRGVDSAFRDAVQVGLAQGHVHDVQAIVAGRTGDLAGRDRIPPARRGRRRRCPG